MFLCAYQYDFLQITGLIEVRLKNLNFSKVIDLFPSLLFILALDTFFKYLYDKGIQPISCLTRPYSSHAWSSVLSDQVLFM